ncbi:prepilin-type N-terminal cleavage/methylation domain-containing protein [Thalassobacillus hwangdonensis]|uniref:Prepilin-type N-terminal cleavage/methylation domain-containing protein n=1 Tax=Thalassobacillus hwangdonensis TaxID=546108 RepID=A0ABW3L2Q0_9BACI
MKLHNERGLTLVELLAVLALSTVVILIAYNLLFSTMGSIDRSSAQTKMRNEAALILYQFDEAMLNVDSIEIDGGGTPDRFTQFTGVGEHIEDKNDGSGGYEFVEDRIAFSISGDDIVIDGNTLNDPEWRFTDSFFKYEGKKLYVQLEVADSESNETYQSSKIYRLKNE